MFKSRLLVIQSFIFLTHSVRLDSLEVSSGLVKIYIVECHQQINPIFSNNITKGQHVY